jgi:hypothetical protein
MAIITEIRIHPAIGIARVGNSPEFFVGPEKPGPFVPPDGFRDPACRLKRQAARFRLFGFAADGTFVEELTAANTDEIEWTAHLVNRKAAALKFRKGLATPPPIPDPTLPEPSTGPVGDEWRNNQEVDRTRLVIDSKEQTRSGSGQTALFTGTFLDTSVPLGEMRIEPAGSLLVLGGFGNSIGSTGVYFADNDGWCDDVSDGPVKAHVTIGGKEIEALPAWVIVAPPKYAPAVRPPVSLYDSLQQIAFDQFKDHPKLKFDPVFTVEDDAKPFYRSVVDHQWVSGLAAAHHVELPPDPAQGVPAFLLSKLRDPATLAGGTMPWIKSKTKALNATVTPLQFRMVQDWANGKLPATGPVPPVYDELDRAALEPCIGGNFYPGVEASWGTGDPDEHRYKFMAPFRLDPALLNPGDVTKQLAVPWQADFFLCKREPSELPAPLDWIAWWPAARPDEVIVEESGERKPWADHGEAFGLVKSQHDMVESWHRLGFVVPVGGKQVERERHTVCQKLELITDRSHVSRGEVKDGTETVLNGAFYVIAEGFTPLELGVAGSGDVTNAGFVTPTIEGAAPQQLSIDPQDVLLEVPGQAGAHQRVTFVYALRFKGGADFGAEVSRTVTLQASKKVDEPTYTASGTITLVHTPNPFMTDGPTAWLSKDVRVFKATEGVPSPTGATIPKVGANDDAGAESAALAYIQDLIATFNEDTSETHPFDKLSIDPNSDTGRLELSRKVEGSRVYNFAVARVRYRGAEAPKVPVRVFFRLFTTAATGLDYDPAATYRRSDTAQPVALLGVQASKLVAIPCYAEPREDTTKVELTGQKDAHNVCPLAAASPGEETHAYFGCWLDFNQTRARFPADVGATPDGPWPSGATSIQELIHGTHQCLVAEVFLPDDPIPAGATPAANDNLAQRNLVFVQSGLPVEDATDPAPPAPAAPGVPAPKAGPAPQKPGGPSVLAAAGRTVQHTFEIRAQPRATRLTTLPGGAPRLAPERPDLLMIRWNDLPRDTRVTLYLPDVDAGDVLRLQARSSQARRLERVDAHTLLCLPGDVTYVPIPPGRARNVAALATLELPAGVRRGQWFHVTVHQISGPRRAVLGAFEIDVPVLGAAELLRPEIRQLSVLRHIARSLAVDDPWHAVFARYVSQSAARVRAFGGDPDGVAPSPDGSGRDEAAERCARRGWWVAALLALLVVVAGLHPLPGYVAELATAAGLAAVAVAWAGCAPGRCRVLLAVLLGLGDGAGVLAALVLAGVAGAPGITVLAAAALAAGVVAAAGALAGCFRLSGG